MPAFTKGQRVTVTRRIYEQGEDLPPGLLASPGEVLEVRKAGEFWDYAVAHPHREPTAMFGVKAAEIEAI